MEEMIERGEIGTVIVKDLSRFGRNYLEAGQYLEYRGTAVPLAHDFPKESLVCYTFFDRWR